jgi:hypothetical protein
MNFGAATYGLGVIAGALSTLSALCIAVGARIARLRDQCAPLGGFGAGSGIGAFLGMRLTTEVSGPCLAREQTCANLDADQGEVNRALL